MKNIVYSLKYPGSEIPVYIGKSSDGVGFFYERIENKLESEKVLEWVSILKKDGCNPTVQILDEDNGEMIDAKLEFWINHYTTRGYYLLNHEHISAMVLDKIVPVSNPECDPHDDYMRDIRQYIRSRRKLIGISQIELSKKSGVGLRFLRDLEQGVPRNFSTDSLMKVLRCVGRVKLGVVDML